ncbi:MAG: 30S ribosomal protein THX [Maribacter sp.]
MGKGDKKSRKGKISNGSFGVRRPRKIKKRLKVEDKIAVAKKK